MSADHVASAIERIKSDPEFAAAVLRDPEAALTGAFDLEPNEWRAVHYGLTQDVSRAIDFTQITWAGLGEISATFGDGSPAQKMTPTVIPAHKMTPTVIPAQKMTPTVIPAQKMTPTVIPAQKMTPTVIPAQQIPEDGTSDSKKKE